MGDALAKKTYYPSKTFDDDLAGFVDLFKQRGWMFSGTDPATLEQDAAAQREQRAAHDALERQYLAAHQQLGVDQEARYIRFTAALNAARGAFRRDKAIMAELSQFKRSLRRARKQAAPEAAADETAGQERE
ncbi:MAG: hypothetical protein HYV63_16855 [Candidatus Schekmanbacteria bacterium]|nr:hypothetical protein [Candidatus Schekmanbacteria bacterium]